MRIITADKAIIPFTKESKLLIKEVIHNNVLYGYNVEVDGVILDTYEDEETAEAVSEHIYNNLDQNINITVLNRHLEVI